MTTMNPKYGKIVRIKRDAYDMLDEVRASIKDSSGLKKISDTEMLSLAVCALYAIKSKGKEDNDDMEDNQTDSQGTK